MSTLELRGGNPCDARPVDSAPSNCRPIDVSNHGEEGSPASERGALLSEATMSLPAYSLHDLRTLRRRYFDEGATIADLVRDTPFTEHQVLGLLVGGTSLPQPLRRLVANALCGDGPESISTVLPRVLADLERAP